MWEPLALYSKDLSLISLVTMNVRKLVTSWNVAVSMVLWYSQTCLCSLVDIHQCQSFSCKTLEMEKKIFFHPLEPVILNSLSFLIFWSQNVKSRFHLCPVRKLLALTVKWHNWLKPLGRPPGDVTSVSKLGMRKRVSISLCH